MMKMNEYHEYCKDEKEPPRLYRIGMFAAMNHVTIKALRYYDEQGLLKPAYVDEETGYRYYVASQIANLHQILALKNIAFSLDEIREIQNGNTGKQVLLQKKHDILKKMAELTQMLAQVESYLDEEQMNLTAPILIKCLPEVMVATMQTRVESYDDLFDLMPAMGIEMERLGCVCAEPDYCFTRYLEHEHKEEQILVETCEAVTKVLDDSELIHFQILPEIKQAACIFHKGSYANFSKSYAIVLKYIEENDYEICGDIRESYIDGIWNKESESDWLTEIQVPVQRK